MREESEQDRTAGDSFLTDCMSELGPAGSLADKNDRGPEDGSQLASRTEGSRLASAGDNPAGERASARSRPSSRQTQPLHLAASTFLSLVMVLGLLLLARFIVPSLVENVRYGWHRGQLRAEYELSDERLRTVSLDSLADVSQLVSQRTGPSVVHINLLRDAETITKFESLIGSRAHPSFKYEGQGSGFVIDSSGYILTNYHVVEATGEIEVTLSDGRQLRAAIVGTDPLTDLAVLKVEATDLLAADWGDSDKVGVGTPVWAVGSPFGLQQTVTFGIISGKHRVDFQSTREAQSIQSGTPYGDLMQSDVALNPGNSGGPLVNAMGQVVGVNAAILGETFRGVSFSIPSRVARRIAEHLINEGEVPRGWLGVELVDLPSQEKFDDAGTPRAGVRVKRFPTDLSSPARNAGMYVGDLIVSFEGAAVTSVADLIRRIGETPVGATVAIEVERDGDMVEFQIRLERRSARL